MKKKLAILIAMMMVMCGVFAACGSSNSSEDFSDSKYVDTWMAQNASLRGESEDVEGGEFSLTLNGDGTGTFTSIEDGGEQETTDITWELTDDGFKTKGDMKLTFTDDGDGIKTKIMGLELHFVRKSEYESSENNESGEESTADVTNYGYTGSDPVEAAVYKYVAEDLSAPYEKPDGAVSIPVVQIVDIDRDTDDDDDDDDADDNEVDVYGVFWVNNYVIEGDTLKCVSGGAHPGKMQLVPQGDVYVVTEFERVEDGSDSESSARDIFEERYDDFSKVNSDSDTREKVRAETIANYVKANGLSVTKYQDEGWDPVELSL
jgi:hypothetical protein